MSKVGKSKQWIFDTIVSNLMKQGKRSRDEVADNCMYRGPNYTKCAIGWLIPDEKYNPKMEINSVTGLLLNFSTSVPWYFKRYRGFLEEAQIKLHDLLPDDNFRFALKHKAYWFAQKNGLNTKILDKFRA